MKALSERVERSPPAERDETRALAHEAVRSLFRSRMDLAVATIRDVRDAVHPAAEALQVRRRARARGACIRTRRARSCDVCRRRGTRGGSALPRR